MKTTKNKIKEAKKGLEDLDINWKNSLSGLTTEQCSIYLSMMKPLLLKSHQEVADLGTPTELNIIMFLENLSKVVGFIDLSRYFVGRIENETESIEQKADTSN